jgi:hypothetical protein
MTLPGVQASGGCARPKPRQAREVETGVAPLPRGQDLVPLEL